MRRLNHWEPAKVRISLDSAGHQCERYYQLYRGLRPGNSLTLRTGWSLPDQWFAQSGTGYFANTGGKVIRAIVTVSCLDNSQPYYDMLRLPENVCFAVTSGPPVQFVILALTTWPREENCKGHCSSTGHIGVFCEPLEFSHCARFTQAIQMVCRKLSLHTKHNYTRACQWS